MKEKEKKKREIDAVFDSFILLLGEKKNEEPYVIQQ